MTPTTRPRGRRRLLVVGATAAFVGAAAAYRRANAAKSRLAVRPGDDSPTAQLGWGDLAAPASTAVHTPDGANLAVWDVGSGPTVVLAHCWGCSHEIWVPVARRLVESGHRVVLYDQRGHGASTRGTAPLSIAVLGDDFAAVLEARKVKDAVLAGHSMGGMTVMSLAAHRPEVLSKRGRALVLVSTAARSMNMGSAQAERFAAGLMTSRVVARVMRSPSGYQFVRGVFGVDPVRSQVDLTKNLFGDCDPAVRGGFLTAIARMNLLEGIAGVSVPTTVMVGTRDRLTAPERADEIVRAIPEARLVTLEGRGHMLPLEDPDAVTDEIIRAVKG
jgi:pimeloyl-ACP methyl ester carboxylesterase